MYKNIKGIIVQFNCSYDELIEPHKLVGHPQNPNKHPDDQIDRLAKIIEYQGQRSPVVVCKDTGFIIVGHGRLEAIRKLGWEKVAVNYQTFKDDAQRYAHMTADNAIAEWAALDLSQINADMLDLGPELDLELLGIKDFVLEPIEKFEEGLTDEDEIPEVKDPITKRGDVWLLGDHRVMCGDSTMIDDVEKLMNGEKADMVFTDPPYNINYESKTSGKIKNDNMSDDAFEDFIKDTYISIDYACSKDASIYICYAIMEFAFEKAIREMDWEVNNKIIWVKDIAACYRAKYKWQYEPIYFCLKGKPKFYGDKKQTNVWNINSTQSAANVNDKGITWFNGGSKDLTLHPTQKPFQLPSKAIENSSQPKDKIFEPFCGSGSTLIAAEKLDRKCYGMELDEYYCDVIINRWQNYTGKKAVLESNGKTYDELKESNV